MANEAEVRRGDRDCLPGEQTPRTTVAAHPAVAKALWAVATALFVLALPVAIILGAVRFAFSWQPVYTYAVQAYRVDETTGFPTSQILAATHQIRNYFTNDRRDLDITVTDSNGTAQPLFNAREIAHMRDVKALVRRMYRLLDGAALVLLLYLVASLLVRRAALRRLAAATLAASLLTSAAILAFGAASLVGFDQLFTEFHVISFSNDFWQLDPATDHLIQIFPQGFWFDVTMFVGLVALLVALSLAVLSGTALIGLRRRVP